MEEVAALGDQHAELAGLLDELGDEGMDRPSWCDGWSVADVVLHLAQTDAMALASLHGRYSEVLEAMTVGITGVSSADDGAAAMVERERGVTSSDGLRKRWSTGTVALREAFATCDPSARVQWVVGTLSARTLATTRLAECWIHANDVAFALGRRPEPTDRLRHIARLAWRTLPYAFGSVGRELSGPVAFELRGPNGDEWRFAEEAPPATVVRGDAVELCLVAGQRLKAAETRLSASGPDADAVLELVRTFA